jgi:hypothetical protein
MALDTPRDWPVAGMICIRPMAPQGETARGLKALSRRIWHLMSRQSISGQRFCMET